MRHRKQRHKLSRSSSHRRATLRHLSAGLIEHERIRTTEAKAKALRPFIERLITLGKKGNLHHRRQVFSALGNKRAVHKLFEDIAPRFTERPGGYTRIIRDNQRAGDGAWMAYIELVEQGAAVAPSAPAEETTEPAPAET